jgi:hypothetical protein
MLGGLGPWLDTAYTQKQKAESRKQNKQKAESRKQEDSDHL